MNTKITLERLILIGCFYWRLFHTAGTLVSADRLLHYSAWCISTKAWDSSVYECLRTDFSSESAYGNAFHLHSDTADIWKASRSHEDWHEMSGSLGIRRRINDMLGPGS
jgi:hypothetical protein